jgi:predicted transcriptional regulator
MIRGNMHGEQSPRATQARLRSNEERRDPPDAGGFPAEGSPPHEASRPARGATTSRARLRRREVGDPLRVRDVMTRKVITTVPESTLKEASDLLLQHHVSGLPVIRGTLIVGILSEKDIVRFVLSKVGRSQLPSHLMALFREITAEQAARTLREVRQVLTSTPVAQAMTDRPILVAPDTPLDQVAGIMIDHRIHRLPVVDRGELVGIITREDMMRFSAANIAIALD